MNFGIQTYQQARRSTDHPINDVIRAMHQCALLVQQAKEAGQAGKFEDRYTLTYKVGQILMVLEAGIQEETDEQKKLAEQLRRSYRRMHQLLLMMNIKNDVTLADALISLLKGYASMWEEVCLQMQQQVPSMPANQLPQEPLALMA